MRKITKIVFLYCGYIANKYAKKQLITSGIFTHYQHIFFKARFIIGLYTFLSHFIHALLDTFFIQNKPVGLALYTQSTAPTITTTY